MGKKHIKLPRRYNPPGRHTPPETLAYLSEAEHDLIRRLTDGTASRGPNGVRSYADDSASSKGVSRAPSSSVSRSNPSGTGSNSSSSRSSSGSSSKSNGSRSGAGVSGRAPGASAAAAKNNANKSAASNNRSQTKTNTAPRSLSGIGSPGRDTALGRAAQAARQNVGVSNPVTTSGRADSGVYSRFTPSLPSLRPGADVMGSAASRSVMGPGGWANMQRVPGGYSSAFVNASHVPMVNWSGSFGSNPNFRNLSQQGEKLYRAVEDTAFRTNQPINVFSGGRVGGGANHKTGNALDTFMRDPVSGAPVGEAKVGRWASFPIAGVSKLMGRPESVANRIASALEGPYKQWSNNVYDTVYQNPDAYSGVRGNLRYGGDFRTGSTAKDYMHHDVTPGRFQPTNHVAALARAKQSEFGGGTMLAGNTPSAPVSTGDPEDGRVQAASAALGSIPRPRPRPAMAPVPIPRPRPGALNAPNLSRPEYTDMTYGVPRARPSLGQLTQNPYDAPRQGQYGGYGNFSPPVINAGLGQNPYDTQRSGQYAGYGNFAPPDRTAPVTRNAFDTSRSPSTYSGYGPASPLGAVAPAPEQPRLTPPIPRARPPLSSLVQNPFDMNRAAPGYAGYGNFTDPSAVIGSLPPGAPKDQSRVPAYPGSNPAGTLTSPYNVAPKPYPFSQGVEPHPHTAPPAPWQYRNETPPAAPHEGTPGSQTASVGEDEPSFWQKGADLFTQVKTGVQEKQEEIKKNVDQYGQDAVLKTMQQMAGVLPKSLTDPGSSRGNQFLDYSPYGSLPMQPQQQAQAIPVDVLTALKAELAAKGATPEELAIIDQLIAQTARA